MKKIFQIAALALLLSTFDARLVTGFAQGHLSPPGAPAPMMRTLDQIEPRTPISSAPFVISEPGSYCLATNLTVSSGDAIVIVTNGVTLDLNGFSISSTAPAANGCGVRLQPSSRDVSLANGHILSSVTNDGTGVFGGGGFTDGVNFSGSLNTTVSRVSVSGVLHKGIFLSAGNSGTVESCVVQTAGGGGISGTVINNSTALDCGDTAIFGYAVSDCCGQSHYGNGIDAQMVQNSRGNSNAGIGISAYAAFNCYGHSLTTGLAGILTITAESSQGTSNSVSGYGLYAANAINCVGYSYSNGYGIYAIRIANSCFGHSDSGVGVSAFIANVCNGESLSGVPLNAVHNVNSF